jgi:hypothetical protein
MHHGCVYSWPRPPRADDTDAFLPYVLFRLVLSGAGSTGVRKELGELF